MKKSIRKMVLVFAIACASCNSSNDSSYSKGDPVMTNGSSNSGNSEN